MATSTRWRAAGVASRMLMARRGFLTVPEFLQPSSLRKEHREKKVVPFPCQAMFDVVANVDEYVTFLPFCVTSRVVSRPSSNSMEADLTVGFQIFTETYRSRVVLESPRRILIKSINSPTFKSIESEWTFRPVSTTSCEVNFRVSFEVGSILHAHAMRLFFDDVARVQLNAFIGQASKLQQQRQLAQKRQQQSPPEPTPAGKPWTVPFLQGKVPAPVLAHLKHVFIAHATAEAGTYKLSLAGFGAACHDLVHTSPWAKASPTLEDLKSISANSQSALAFAVFASYIMPSQHQPHTHEQPPHRQELSFTEFATGVYLTLYGTVDDKAVHMFQAIDILHDGRLSPDELRRAMETRLRVVRDVFPLLLQEQLALAASSSSSQFTSSSTNLNEEGMKVGLLAIESLMAQVESDIPLAVHQIFLSMTLEEPNHINLTEWRRMWHDHPELVEMMTIDGMKKILHVAAVVTPANR